MGLPRYARNDEVPDNIGYGTYYATILWLTMYITLYKKEFLMSANAIVTARINHSIKE